MNKKGQTFTGFMVFAAIAIALLVMSPILLKVWNSSIPAFGEALQPQSQEAADTVDYVSGVYIGWFDSIVLFMFLTLLILLIVSSILIDVSPFFMVLYIIDGIFYFAFAPAISPLLYKIYENPNFAPEVAQIPGLAFITQHFWPFVLGVFIFSGVLIFVKVRFLPSR